MPKSIVVIVRIVLDHDASFQQQVIRRIVFLAKDLAVPVNIVWFDMLVSLIVQGTTF